MKQISATVVFLFLSLIPSLATANTVGGIDFTDYIFRANLENSTCPNNMIEDAEQCDDGNITPGDGCNAACRLFQCGDTLLDAPFEECDDGNTQADDGCDGNFCFAETGFACAGAPSTCSAICGDGLILGLEACDDNNLTDGDGCTVTCDTEVYWNCTGQPSMCIQIAYPELEPNDDGSPSTGGSFISGNDFGAPSIANAETQGLTPLAAGARTWIGAINAAGDEDIFAIENNDGVGRRVRLDVWNQASGAGIGCGMDLDSALNVRASDDAGGLSAAQISNNNRSPTDLCPALSFDLDAGQKRFAHLVDVGDNAATAPYLFIVESAPWMCGNNQLEPGENCDDGNLVNGDGCSAICLRDFEAYEVEPNNNFAEADGNVVQISDTAVILGGLTDGTDEKDFYRVQNNAPAVVRFESFTTRFDCNAPNAPNTLRLFNGSGVQLLQDVGNFGGSGWGINACAALVYPLENPATHYIQIEESDLDASIPNYLLEARFMADKGSESENNNGFSAANQNFYEPNQPAEYNAFVYGEHLTNADIDWYIIRVPAGKGIRAEIIEGNRAEETCESGGIDSQLTLLNDIGPDVLVDDDDDGRRSCSLIDGTGATPHDNLARNTSGDTKNYYLMVRASTTWAQNPSDPNGQFKYRLVVTIR